MKASSKAAVRRLPTLALLAAALVISACSTTPTRDDKPGKKKEPDKALIKATADKADAEGRFKEGVEMMKNNQPQDAEKVFAAMTKDFPDFAGPWTNLGIINAKAKRRDPAINAFTRATQLNPNNAVAYNWLGILNREGGNYPAAKLAYEKALQITPDDAQTRLNYAILLDQYLKQPQEAVAQYKRYQQLAKKEDLRVMAWVAEIESKSRPATPPAAAPAAPAPAGAAAPAAKAAAPAAPAPAPTKPATEKSR